MCVQSTELGWLTRSLSAARTLLKLETLMNVNEGEWQLFNFYFYYSSFSLRDEVAECDRRRGELLAHFLLHFNELLVRSLFVCV